MKSDKDEVFALVVELTRLVQKYDGPLTGQSVSNMIYGLQGLSSDHPVVLTLVDELSSIEDI